MKNIVRLKIPMELNGRKFVAGEPIIDPPASLVRDWQERELVVLQDKKDLPSESKRPKNKVESEKIETEKKV